MATYIGSVRDAARQITVHVQLKGARQWRWRLHLGAWLIRLAAWIMWMNVEIKGLD